MGLLKLVANQKITKRSRGFWIGKERFFIYEPLRVQSLIQGSDKIVGIPKFFPSKDFGLQLRIWKIWALSDEKGVRERGL